MYRIKEIVIEDFKVGKEAPSEMRLFTGCGNGLELPITVSFMDEGDYTVHIDKNKVSVKRVEEGVKVVSEKALESRLGSSWYGSSDF